MKLIEVYKSVISPLLNFWRTANSPVNAVKQEHDHIAPKRYKPTDEQQVNDDDEYNAR